MRLLVIDDDADIIDSIQFTMLSLGYECDIYQNPRDGIEVFRNGNYDVVVLDFKMPEMNGIEVLKEIRIYEPQAKVILMTAYPNILNTVSALNNGVYAFMRKPIKFEHFIKILERIKKEKEILK